MNAWLLQASYLKGKFYVSKDKRIGSENGI